MEQKLIHSRVATREHFFYRSPKLEIREEGLLFFFLVKNIIKHTQLHISDKTIEKIMLEETKELSAQFRYE